MAGGGDIAVRYNQNHSASDETYYTVMYTTAPSYTSLNFTAPVGMEFSEWNTEQDGSGISYAVGDTVALGQYNTAELYAIWVAPAVPYLTNDTELTNIADAIRAKAGISEALEWPNGFISAIKVIGATKYTIRNDSSAKVSVDKSLAYEGETITITAITQAYVAVYYNNGSSVFILKETINANETATFIMPAYNIIVMATIPK